MYVCSVVSDWVSVDLTESPWTVAYQAPLFMGFPRLKNTGVGCHFLLQGLFPGMEPVSLASPALVGRFFTTELLGKPPTVLLQSKQLVVDCFLIIILLQFSSVQFSNSVVSDSLRPHESQHTRPPCPSPSPGVHSNSRPSSQWCHPAISSSVVPFSSCPQSLPASESFPMSQLCMRWPKYWSFSFSIIPSKEHPGLISFRMDWLDLLAVQGTLKSSPTPQFKSINSSALSLLHSPTLTSIHDHWKNHSLD